MYSVSSQHGHRLKNAQHDGAWQHTQQPLVIFPGAKLSTIFKYKSSSRECMRRPVIRHDDDEEDAAFEPCFAKDEEDVERDIGKDTLKTLRGFPMAPADCWLCWLLAGLGFWLKGWLRASLLRAFSRRGK